MTKYFVTIAGNIGVGKSTLTTLLASKMGWKPILEAVEENPYLPDFYRDMRRWGFHSQVFFLSRRLQQHYELLQHTESVLQDRSIYEDAEIFARNLHRQRLMDDRDWQVYYDFYRILSLLLKPPNLIVYLKASVPTLLRRIKQRGRKYEHSITDDYLSQLNNLYDEWASTFSLCPLITVETDPLDYVQHEDHLEWISQKVQEKLYGKDYLMLEAK